MKLLNLQQEIKNTYFYYLVTNLYTNSLDSRYSDNMSTLILIFGPELIAVYTINNIMFLYEILKLFASKPSHAIV